MNKWIKSSLASNPNSNLAYAYDATISGNVINRLGFNAAILTSAYHMLVREQDYIEMGANYFDRRNPESTAKRLAKRIEKLGYQVNLQPQAVPTAA